MNKVIKKLLEAYGKGDRAPGIAIVPDTKKLIVKMYIEEYSDTKFYNQDIL